MEYEVINISGFDKDGEPEIRINRDGSLHIVFNFMPPLNGLDDPIDLPIFDAFDKALEKELNVKVIWEDRESFYIPKPHNDTVEKVKFYLESFWEEHKI